MTFSRSFKVSLLISTLLHLGAFAALNQETVSQKILASPEALLARKSKPRVVRFELVNTPASAETPEAPKKTNLMSDKNTRAQDRFESEKKLEDSPHMEGKHEESKDTRPKAIVTPPPVVPKTPPKPQKPAEPSPPEKPVEKPKPRKEAKEPLPEEPVAPEEELTEPEKKIEIAPEPEEKEVIQLAKKLPSPAEPAVSSPPPTPRVISAASAKNAGADAQITGELSFGATRHFFGEYLLGMKQAVERQWVSRLVSRYTGIVSSRAVIDFKIQPDGSVTDMVVHSAEGDSYFALLCVSSINDAQPFDRIPYDEIQGLPDEFMNKPLNIRFTFRYN